MSKNCICVNVRNSLYFLKVLTISDDEKYSYKEISQLSGKTQTQTLVVQFFPRPFFPLMKKTTFYCFNFLLVVRPLKKIFCLRWKE